MPFENNTFFKFEIKKNNVCLKYNFLKVTFHKWRA